MNFDCVILFPICLGKGKERSKWHSFGSCVHEYMRFSILKARLRDNRAVQGGICGEVYGFGEDSEEL